MSSVTLLNSTNKFVRLKSAYEIIEHWNFLQQAMHELNDPRRARAGYDAESFFNMLAKVAALGDDGLVAILTSKNGKPLGFGCAFSATDFNGDSCFYVWAAYSNGKCQTTLSELQHNCELYARSIGQTVVKTATPRMTGAACRLFEDRLGYTREFFTFRKDI